ncbi:29892_t:CDS:1, partial [Gigaspora margarita]
FAQVRENFQTYSKPEKDAFITAQLLNTSGGETSLSKRLKNKERTNQRNFYR